ncbi:hypothetical protein WJX81_001275 [Elliptochloris bilobata]|uniref:CHCH domain-containing protein n=1 Tax=Elliptochloris bilobata TaxID=381761 RepID=A0AAW1SEA2_9CHLO
MSQHAARATAAAESTDGDPYTPQGCENFHSKLEECLAENDRDWRACQREVHAWRDCFARHQAAKRQPQE